MKEYLPSTPEAENPVTNTTKHAQVKKQCELTFDSGEAAGVIKAQGMSYGKRGFWPLMLCLPDPKSSPPCKQWIEFRMALPARSLKVQVRTE